MSTLTKRILTGALLVVAIAAVAWPKIRSSSSGDAPAGPSSFQPQAMQLKAHVVTPSRLRDRIYVTGTIRANEEVELRSEASGKILEIFFREGRRVSKGDTLVKINDSELQAQLRKAEYRQTLAVDRERRQFQIKEQGGISQEEYEATLNEVNVLKADVELITAQIEKTQVLASFDGVVGLRQVSPGSYITSSTPIATLQDVNPIKIDFAIPERYAQRVRVGDEIFFSVDGLADSYKGTIYATEPRIEADTRTLLLRARCPNPRSELIPGAFAEIELVFEEIDDALSVPAMAVIPEFGGKKVFVVQDGKAMPRAIETGIRSDQSVQVTDGLAPGDTVLVSGIQSLRPGIPVIPVLDS